MFTYLHVYLHKTCESIFTPIMFCRQLSVKAILLARRTKYVSDRTSAAVVMDILARAATPVRDHFVCYDFLPSFTTFFSILN